jgi:thioesterase domain-containing protein
MGRLPRGAFNLSPKKQALLEVFRKLEGLGASESVEYQLVEIWERLLGVHPVGIRDDFFELGGDVPLAGRLMAEIERVCGNALPLSTLFAGPTIEHLARVLMEQQAAEQRSPIIKIHPNGSKRPFFFLHGDPVGGGFYCLSLARGLGEEQPLFALIPHGSDGQPVPETIEEMVAFHLETLRAVQPEGPYLLGGFCNGGVIAFEMARQLRSQGEQVDLLVLVASAGFNAGFRWLHRLVTWFGTWRGFPLQDQVRRFQLWQTRLMYLEQLARESARLRPGAFSQLVRATVALVLELVKRGYWFALNTLPFRKSRHRTNPSSQAFHPAAPGRGQEAVDAYARALARYFPKPYPGRVTLFVPNESAPVLLISPTFGWGKVAAQVEVRVLPGDHLGCITTHVKELAGQLSACLRKAHSFDRRGQS